MVQTSLPPQLPPTVLAKRDLLPDKPAPVTLTGQYVSLEPLVVARDAQPLFEVSNGNAITLGERSIDAYDADALIWRYMFEGPFENMANFAAGLQVHVNASNGLCLCVFDLASGRHVGVTNFMNNSPAHLKIELGGIWYSPVVQRTQTNTEATYLMLKHAFDLGYRRLEWKCHSHNERSRRAALRMGFKFEGIQESHMIVKGRNRDTAWFRILETEWPEVKEKLELLLY
jgi:RimJ/RimL family protein N-acetyltransferase